MIIQTTRFGKVQITEEDVILFPEGILGFNQLRAFVLLDDPTDEIFAWLQSCEIPEIAFPVLEPELFAENYRPQMGKSDMIALQMDAQTRVRYFSIITIPEDPRLMTANMKAPIVVHVEKRMARQCVLQDNNLAIREPIFALLQQRVVQTPPKPIKSQALDWGMAIRVPESNLPLKDKTL